MEKEVSENCNKIYTCSDLSSPFDRLAIRQKNKLTSERKDELRIILFLSIIEMIKRRKFSETENFLYQQERKVS